MIAVVVLLPGYLQTTEPVGWGHDRIACAPVVDVGLSGIFAQMQLGLSETVIGL